MDGNAAGDETGNDAANRCDDLYRHLGIAS
jgi:hypothetical protein